MESPEKANMQAAQEFKTAEKHIHQRINSIHLLAEMVDCSTVDVEIMLSLLQTHGVYEIIEAAEEFTEGTTLKWSFGVIVTASKNVVLKRLYGKIDNTLHSRLSVVTVSTQPAIYGTALNSDGLDEKTLMEFSFMIKYGVNLARMSAIGKAYNASMEG